MKNIIREVNIIMPRYNFKHKTSGEIIEKTLRISELDKWKVDNPEWETVHLSAPQLVSGSKSALTMAGSGWKDVLGKVKDNAGRNNTIND